MSHQRRALCVFLALSVLAVGAGCAQKKASDVAAATTLPPATSSSDPRGEQSTTTVARSGLSLPEVEAAMLTVQDLPPGWATTSPDADEGSGELVCPAARASLPQEMQTPTSDSVDVAFLKGQIGPALLQSAGVIAEPAEFGRARAAVLACEGETWEDVDDEGEVSTLTLTELRSPDVGDEAFAVRISGEFAGGGATVDVVFALVADVLVLLGGVSVVTVAGSAPLDPLEFDEIVAIAIDKVEIATAS